MTAQRVDRRQALTLLGGAGLAGLAGCAAATSAPTPAPPAPSPTSPASAAPPASPSVSASPPPSLTTLSGQLSAPLLRPGDSACTTAARLYNPRFDAVAKPMAIAQCQSVADVAACVRFAADNGAPLRIRGGGHSYGGWSTGPGLVADLSNMAAIEISAGTAKIAAGARLIDVYNALGAKSVAIAAGSCPTVGLTGLTLGGGVGVLARAYGLTCDAVTGIEIVTADGHVREISAGVDSDLFWALRGGGGGSFGAVTSLTVKTRPAPTVNTFYLSWEVEHSQAVLTAWQGWMAAADRQLWSTCKLLTGPTAASRSVSVSGTWIGPASSLSAALTPLLTAIGASPASRTTSTLSYQQAMFFEAGCSGQSADTCVNEALAPAKRQPFAATSAILTSPLPTAGVEAAVNAVAKGLDLAGLVQGGVSFDALGGAVSDVSATDTAFAHRAALATLQFTATYSDDSADPATYDSYVRAERQALQPFTGDGAYVNYADATIADYPSAYWGSNYPRLQTVKKSYDPGNVFTFPQAVQLP